MSDDHWLAPAQQHAVAAALDVLQAWTGTRHDPDSALLEALRRQDPATAMIGLATVARLFAIELAHRSDRSEQEVIAGAAVRTLPRVSVGEPPRPAR